MTDPDTIDEPTPLHTGPIAGWRIAGWSAAAALLVLPALAMQFSTEVQWTPGDFLAAAIMLIGLGTGIEIAVRIARGGAQRLGIIITAIACFLTFWANGAVGFIGSESEPVNLGFYAIVIAILFASVISWFRPHIMRWATAVAALGQYALGIAALQVMPGHAVEWGILTVFAVLWLCAALAFHKACGET